MVVFIKLKELYTQNELLGHKPFIFYLLWTCALVQIQSSSIKQTNKLQGLKIKQEDKTMADTIEIEIKEYTDIKDNYPFWSQFPLLKILYEKGRNPIIYDIDLNVDTSTVNNLTETFNPTNEVINFAVPEQIYIRSDDAGDISKKIDVIGQKADGSFGQFTLTSDDSDGTVGVDCGTWKFMAFVIKNDDWAGNVIIDNDGASSTVYFTCALGVSSTTGILVIPDGYYGACFYGSARATVACGANHMLFSIDHVYSAFLEVYNPVQRHHSPDIHDDGKIVIKTAYLTAAFASKGHLLIALWSKPSNVA